MIRSKLLSFSLLCLISNNLAYSQLFNADILPQFIYKFSSYSPTQVWQTLEEHNLREIANEILSLDLRQLTVTQRNLLYSFLLQNPEILGQVVFKLSHLTEIKRRETLGHCGQNPASFFNGMKHFFRSLSSVFRSLTKLPIDDLVPTSLILPWPGPTLSFLSANDIELLHRNFSDKPQFSPHHTLLLVIYLHQFELLAPLFDPSEVLAPTCHCLFDPWLKNEKGESEMVDADELARSPNDHLEYLVFLKNYWKELFPASGSFFFTNTLDSFFKSLYLHSNGL